VLYLHLIAETQDFMQPPLVSYNKWNTWIPPGLLLDNQAMRTTHWTRNYTSALVLTSSFVLVLTPGLCGLCWSHIISGAHANYHRANSWGGSARGKLYQCFSRERHSWHFSREWLTHSQRTLIQCRECSATIIYEQECPAQTCYPCSARTNHIPKMYHQLKSIRQQ
jgi:hypothetical protein